MKVDLRPEHQLLAVESEHHVNVMVELVAPEAPGDDERAPLRLALVVDRSGSMAGEKLATTKRCAAYLVERLGADDEIAIVAYDDDVDLVAPLGPADTAGLRERIASIGPRGMTNLSGGWLKGVEELRRRDDGVRRVLLLTDGMANVGITEPDDLVEMSRRASAVGIGTTTVGFGADFHEDLLTAMADAGGGGARYAATVEDAPAIFADEFDGLVELSAQNVSVEVRPRDEVEMVGVLNEYPAVAVDGGIQIAVGDAYAGQQLRVVFRLHVPELAALGPAKIADVVVRYVDVTDGVIAKEIVHPLHVNLVSADEAAAAGSDPVVTEEVLVLDAARRVAEARRLADEGDHDAARHVLDEAVRGLREVAAGSDRADELEAKAAELDAVASHVDAAAYSPSASKRLHYSSQEMRRRKRGPWT